MRLLSEPGPEKGNDVTLSGNLRGRSAEFWVAVVGAAAGVIGAVAATAVFVIPSADGRGDGPAAAPSRVTPASTAPSAFPSAAPATSGPAPAGSPAAARPLASLVPTAGVDSVRADGDDLALACPSNQSDDSFREVSYPLPARYTSFASGIRVAGDGDPEALAGISVFIQHRVDRSDNLEQVGTPIALTVGASSSFTRPLGDAVQLTIRVQCQTRSQQVLLQGPRLIR